MLRAYAVRALAESGADVDWPAVLAPLLSDSAEVTHRAGCVLAKQSVGDRHTAWAAAAGRITLLPSTRCPETVPAMADSLFEPAGLAAMLHRIERLSPDAQRQWGKMSAAQMLAHCQRPLRVAVGELPLKRSLVGLLFGRMAKRQLLAPKPWKQGMPTAPEFKVTDPRDFAVEKAGLTKLVRRFGERGPAGLTDRPHPFFGPLTADEWQALQWRHLDHHLRQFGA